MKAGVFFFGLGKDKTLLLCIGATEALIQGLILQRALSWILFNKYQIL